MNGFCLRRIKTTIIIENAITKIVEIINNDGEKELRPYRASKYITEYYKTKNKLTDALFDKQIITYKSIGDVLGYTETITRN